MSVSVPFFDWKQLYLERRDDYIKIFDETLSRGGFIMQKDVRQLEETLEAYLNVKHVVALSDATNALLLGLRASGLQAGDEVIIPSHSFLAAPQSIHYAGGVPVPCELGPDWMVDPADMESRITEKTRVLMPVQVNGRSADMDRILDIGKRHNLIVVEDSAQALGAKYKGKMVGTMGLWGVFSFYPSKMIGTFGDAGALVTNDDDIAAKVRAMRNHGANADKVIEKSCDIWGTNSRMDNLHAAILNFKLTWYDEAIQRRIDIAQRYNDAFAGFSELTLPPAPAQDPDYGDVYQNYEMTSTRRDALRAYLSERGIGTIIQWGGIALHQMSGLGYSQSLPKTDTFFEQSLLLPMNHFLTDEQIDHVISSVVAFHS